MALTDQDIDRIRDAVWNDKIESDGRSARKMLRQASKVAGLEDRIAGRVTQLLLNEPGDIAATVTADQIEAAVKQALREGTED